MAARLDAQDAENFCHPQRLCKAPAAMSKALSPAPAAILLANENHGRNIAYEN